MSRNAATRLKAGAALDRQQHLYVERNADRELFDLLKAGKLCYVLAPHRVGKSSLQVSVQDRLRDEGIRCVRVNVQTYRFLARSPEQSFRHILEQVAYRLELSDRLSAFTREHPNMSVVDYWSYVLGRLPSEDSGERVVLFLDEINSVLRHGGAEGFFALVRSLYEKYTDRRRWTFCLLGVVALEDLVPAEDRLSIDVAYEIAVEDFTRKELDGFTPALRPFVEDPPCLLGTVYDWANGHPFMTQRILIRLQERGHVASGDEAARVKEVVEELFLTTRPMEDPALGVVETYLGKDNPVWQNVWTAQMLELYGGLLDDGKDVRTNGRDPVQTALRLTGVAADRCEDDGTFLRVRNPIFGKVFDREWVRDRQAERFLAGPVEEWRKSHPDSDRRSPDRLLRGQPLHDAAQWAKGRNDLTPDEQEFITRSEEADRKRLRRHKRTWATIAALILLFAGIASWSWHGEWNERREKEQTLGRLYNTYVSHVETSPPLEALWSLVLLAEQEGIELAPSERLRLSYHAQRLPRLLAVVPHKAPLGDAAFLPKSSSAAILTGDQDGRVTFWETAIPDALTIPNQDGPVVFRETLREAAHGDAVTRIIPSSPDGLWAVTLSRDKTARVWDVLKGKSVGNPLPHDGVLTHAAFSAHGRRLLTCGYDGFARVWEQDADGEFQSVTRFEHAGWVTGAGLSSDGSRAVTCAPTFGRDAKHVARLWNVPGTQDESPQLLPHDDRVTTVQFDPNGKRILTASRDGNARLWSIPESGEVQKTIRLAHDAPVRSALFDPKGKRILTITADNIARLWKAEEGKRVGELMKVGAKVRRARFSPDGKRIVIAADDGIARVYDAGRARNTDLRHRREVRDARFSANGRFVLTACDDGTARLWKLPRSPRYVLRGVRGIRSGAFDHRGARLATVDWNGAVHLWTKTSQVNPWQKANIALPDAPPMKMISFAGSESNYLLGLCRDEAVYLWEASSGRLRFDTASPHYGVVVAAEVSADGTQLVTATDATVDLWNVETRGRLRLESLPPNSKPKLAFNEDGSRIAVGQADGRVRLYNPATGTQVGELLELPAGIKALRFSGGRESELLVAACADCGVRVWDLPAHGPSALKMTLPHNDAIVGMGLLQDGRLLVTGSADGTVGVWDLNTGRHVVDLVETSQGLRSVSLSPDGRWLFIAGERAAWVSMVPQPQQGTPQQLRAWAECYTGVTMRELGKPEALTVPQWQAAGCESKAAASP